MIKMKYLNFRNPVFLHTMAKIARCPIKDPKALYNALRISKKVTSEGRQAEEVFMRLLKQHAVLDAAGGILPIEDKPGTYQIKEESKGEWEQKIKDYMDIEWEMERYPLKLADISAANLTPEELHAIEEILDLEDLSTL